MANVPYWDSESSGWDECTLGGFPLPGLTKVIIKRTRKIDAVSVPGGVGTSMTDKGPDPASVSLEITLWTEEHLGLWEELLPLIDPRPASPKEVKGGTAKKQRAQPFTLDHPVATLRLVTDIFILSIDGPDRASDGIYTIKIECIEFFPLKVVKAPTKVQIPGSNTVSGSGSGSPPAASTGAKP